MKKKKTRTIKEGIIYYTLVIGYAIFAIAIGIMCWGFGNMFDSKIWVYICGILAGVILVYPFTKTKER